MANSFGKPPLPTPFEHLNWVSNVCQFVSPSKTNSPALTPSRGTEIFEGRVWTSPISSLFIFLVTQLFLALSVCTAGCCTHRKPSRGDLTTTCLETGGNATLYNNLLLGHVFKKASWLMLSHFPNLDKQDVLYYFLAGSCWRTARGEDPFLVQKKDWLYRCESAILHLSYSLGGKKKSQCGHVFFL